MQIIQHIKKVHNLLMIPVHSRTFNMEDNVYNWEIKMVKKNFKYETLITEQTNFPWYG